MALPSDRWSEVKQILANVVNFPEGERQAFLKNACGTDQELLSEVESLLACHELAEEAGVLKRLNSLGVSPRKALDAWAAALEPTVSFKRHDGETTTMAPATIRTGERPSLDDFGDYELLNELGRGGMGVVYKARQKSLNRTVALKMISSRGFSNEEAERFRIEAQAAGKLDHPGIASVYEVGEQDGRHYYSMAFIDGPSLSVYTRERDKKLPYVESAALVKYVAEAMHYAHTKGVIHRDLKPGNIMLDEQRMPKIVDFGLAREIESDSNLTQDGQFLGTPSYAPPEQSLRARDVGPAADIYSIGAVLYYLLTDLPPFRADNVAETILLARTTEPVAPEVIDSKVPKDLQTICLKCLEKEPAKRYTSGRELADELQRFLDGEPIEARAISRVERVWRWSKRNRAVSTLILATTLSIPLTFVGLLYHIHQLNAGNERSRSALHGSVNTITTLLVKMSNENLSDEPGMHEVRAELLQEADREFNSLLDKFGGDSVLQPQLVELRVRMAELRYEVGEMQGEIESNTTALSWHRQAKLMLDDLLKSDPDNTKLLEQMSDVYVGIGKCLTERGELEDAMAAFEQSRDIRKRLVTGSPKDPELGRKFASSLMNLGICAKTQGRLLRSGRHLNVAKAHLDESFNYRDRLRSQGIIDAELLRDQGKCLIELAYVTSMLSQDLVVAKQYLETAREQFLEAQRLDPSELDNSYFVGLCYQLLAGASTEGEARENYDRAIQVLEPLARQNRKVLRYQVALAGTHLDLGSLLSGDPGDIAIAKDHLNSALQIFSELIRNGSTQYEEDLARVTQTLDTIASRRSDLSSSSNARSDDSLAE
ncbi:MAG: serine/threonine protein kinase [Planctomycetaceae bacterium]|nr:serine/threonine protein kinase [Planctomycetales bacterium]MCB9924168.1 serine/threonine protein kinase [Planctomycetaceae bacterium]